MRRSCSTGYQYVPCFFRGWNYCMGLQEKMSRKRCTANVKTTLHAPITFRSTPLNSSSYFLHADATHYAKAEVDLRNGYCTLCKPNGLLSLAFSGSYHILCKSSTTSPLLVSPTYFMNGVTRPCNMTQRILTFCTGTTGFHNVGSTKIHHVQTVPSIVPSIFGIANSSMPNLRKHF